VSRLLTVFGEASALLAQRFPDLEILLPAVPHLRADILRWTADWPVRPQILEGEEAKLQAFRTARAALAASGTVTLELALAQVPTVVAYRVGYIEGEIARRLISVESASLPNLILGRKLLPEFIDRGWNAQDLAESVARIMENGVPRQQQLDGFDEVRALMSKGILTPSASAAALVLQQIRTRQ
jgi:lipid-A-disaccharide synthase